MSQNKKVFDVVPPQREISPAPLKPRKEDAVKPEEPKPSLARSPRVSFKKTPLFIIGGIVLVMIFGWIFIEPKAEVEIWPVKEQVSQSVKATVYAGSVGAGDIAGEVFEVVKFVSDKFDSSNTKLKMEKASGTITIYNAYSTNVQSLVANTRFVSGDGKLFRSLERVNLPGAHYEGSKLVPGTVDIEVVADQAGDEYNIGPSTFSLPGLAGTASYTSIYAKSSGSMTGGVSREVPQITQEDIEKARGELTDRALEESRAALEKMVPSEGDYVILEGAIDLEIVNFETIGEVGEELSDFWAEAESEGRAMVFQKSEVREFARNYLTSVIPAGQLLHEDSLQVEYTVEEVAMDENRIELTLEISCETYQAIDKSNLKETVKDKNPEAITRILRDYPQVSRAKVDLWPFWVERSPKDAERINIEIRLD
jgi:hypothetical protein